MTTVDALEMGERIKKQRLLLGYSREKLAELTDITPRFCYDLELGLKNMSVATLCKMSAALHLPTDYILFGTRVSNDLYIAADCLVESCPTEHLEHLEGIISHYLQAVSEITEQHSKNSEAEKD